MSFVQTSCSMASLPATYGARTYHNHIATITSCCGALRHALNRIPDIHTETDALGAINSHPNSAFNLFYTFATLLQHSPNQTTKPETLLAQLRSGRPSPKATSTLADSVALLRLMRRINKPRAGQDTGHSGGGRGIHATACK